MNNKSALLSALALAAATALPCTAWAAGAGHDHQPRHGGVVAEVRGIDYELVAQPTQVLLYLRGHGQAIDLGKASAKLTLLSAGTKQTVELKPSGDKLAATGSFKLGPGSKAVAVVTVADKAATVRFALK
jgi:hypothetical protein